MAATPSRSPTARSPRSAQLLRAREVSSRELTEACLARIDRDAERLNTFLAVGRERALAAADAADAALAAATRSDGRCWASRTR